MSAGALAAIPDTQIIVRDDVSSAASERYVESHASASAYHRPGWLDVIGEAFGHETRYLVAESANGIAGVLPLVLFRSRLFGRFVVSIPFLNYGGILADTAGAERALLDRAIAETKRIGGSHLELRHTRQLFSELPAKRHKVAMRLSLATTIDQQWQRLDRKVRNQIRKGEKSDLSVQTGGAELLDSFYAVFARNMRDLGTPVYSPRFFRAVLSMFPDETRVLTVASGGRPVAASVVHWHRDTIEVPWASAIREFNPLCANVLLYWHMLRFAIERGLRIFDFGRSTPNEGTYLFKKQWGAEPSDLVWEYWMADGCALPDLNPKNPKFSLAVDVWRRLPVRVATTFGPMIVRNIP
jgi:FemAB-related protein (PEP-CTERM system-associated)